MKLYVEAVDVSSAWHTNLGIRLNSVRLPQLYLSPTLISGVFLCLRFSMEAAMSLYQDSHEEIYNRYHKTDNPVTKRSYLDILKTRASNGSKDAASFVRKIERVKQ